MIVTQDSNKSPRFNEGLATTREVVENTAVGQPVGAPVTATDPDQHTLTYSMTGADAASFSLDAATGQLFTKTVLDYENPVDANLDGVYEVRLAVADGHGGHALRSTCR